MKEGARSVRVEVASGGRRERTEVRKGVGPVSDMEKMALALGEGEDEGEGGRMMGKIYWAESFLEMDGVDGGVEVLVGLGSE